MSLDIHVEQPLSEVVKYLRDRSGANVVILDGSGDKLQDLDIQDVDWRDALDYACQMASCVVTRTRSGVLTITDPPRVDFDFEEDREIAEICHTIGKVTGSTSSSAPR